MSKLSFRARALDASKALPIYRDTEIPDTADCSSINRTVPQMPTGMEKEEESEHHLQQAICTGTTIPTPEVFSIDDLAMYDYMYPPDYKTPRQLIYMQPFSMEADIPDYDMDSDDELWINGQSIKLELTPDKFEEMMDRLEKGSGQTVVTLQEAKALIKEDDDLIIAVYDYWLTKRLKTQHHLIPQVRTEARHGISNHNPYIAFRRRTEKMQTRKNRKNDESSYEKMLKLKRDLSRAVTLLEMVKRREKSKREQLHLSIEVFEKRYQAGDFTGQLINEAMSQRPSRPAFTPLYQGNQMPWSKDNNLLTSLNRKEKRQYKKRRHKSSSKPTLTGSSSGVDPNASSQGLDLGDGDLSSDDEVLTPPSEGDEEEEEGAFPFRRRLNCLYNLASDPGRSPHRCSGVEEGTDDKYSFLPASTQLYEYSRFIGAARRRMGRGGRMMVDRQTRDSDNFWRSLGYEVYDSASRPDMPNTVAEALTLGHPPIHDFATLCISEIAGKPMPEELLSKRTTEPAPSIRTPTPRVCKVVSDTRNVDEVAMSELTGKSPRLGTFMGSVVSKEDEVMLFDVASLQEEPSIDTDGIGAPYFLDGELENPNAETSLLDKPHADLYNMNILNTPEVERTPDWFEFPDWTVDSIPPSDLYETSTDPQDNGRSEKRRKIEVSTSCTSASESESDPDNSQLSLGEDNEDNVVSSQASTVSINVLFSPDNFVHHSNGEATEVEKSAGQGSDATPVGFPPDKCVHHTNGDAMEVEDSNGQGNARGDGGVPG